ncbi:MAG: cytochrome c biogenesis protein CcsA [Candidatus Omnitrophica bacterium]|nr:cytochrome c biogenesis protein CcsA [Candidatus Omnitrophota bacterium]
MMRRLFLLIFAIITSLPVCAVELPNNIDFDAVRDIPILEGGRHKPLDTFAGEAMREITGRWNFNKQDPLAYLFSFMISDEWLQEPLFRIDYLPLKEVLGVDSSAKHLSYNQIISNPGFKELIPQVSQKIEHGAKLNRLENEIATLYHKLILFQEVQSGEALTIVPPQGDDQEAAWLTINHAHGYSEEIQQSLQDAFTNLLAAVKANSGANFNNYGESLKQQLAQLNPTLYPPMIDVAREISYNHTRPFLRSWIFYLLSFLLFLFALYFKTNSKLYWTAMAVISIGFAYNTWGLILRSLVSHRPPVSNMYESVIFVGWGIILFALIFEFVYRERWFGVSASILGVGMLVLADILPFDPNIEPLVPVLRSNYWLIIHVLTITLSYSAFALAMGMAHINLGIYFYLPKRRDLLAKFSLFTYRVLQVGTVLLAAGTILGGVWAAESWGRFWGWDPKETWALISLLGYMAILHARHTNWIADFGTAVCSVIGFWLILMTWYGVNFVLATGLHSYGFGSGGGKYIIGYLLLETLFLVGVAYKYNMSSPPAPPAQVQEENA